MAISKADRERLEQMGQAHVRLIVSNTGFGHPLQSYAREWLAEFDEAERLRNETSQASQMRTALSASRAAWIAAIAAIVAAVIAMIGTIVTVLAWIFPRP